LLCDGAEVSRTTYEALYLVIGTYYGEGDESTTFNLPNLTPENEAYVASYIIKT
jgi:microcystin-dependent protein